MPLQAATQTARLITARNLWSQPQEAGKLLLEVKKQEIRKTGVLEYFAPQGQGLGDVGGLENVKSWVRSRQKWFEQDIKPEMRPRAILLEGFPGCGKTFIARAIAQEWRVPQINFEISRLQSKWVGESESNTYQALRAIEASAPNILFMDEIEKAFSGVGGDSSGVTTRQFGTFLSWLNDHDYPIFFIATSNDRDKLPPELFRAGRFDETFIVMPPNTRERRDIIQKRTEFYQIPSIPQSILEFLVKNTRGFSGAELDKLVKETICLAGLSDSPKDTHWRQALSEIQPQYRTPRMQTLLQNYRKLLEEGAGQPASEPESGFLENLIQINDS
jgi:SpoVK/Ycf46/Vps4 family AAA+-type ATPase